MFLTFFLITGKNDIKNSLTTQFAGIITLILLLLLTFNCFTNLTKLINFTMEFYRRPQGRTEAACIVTD